MLTIITLQGARKTKSQFFFPQYYNINTLIFFVFWPHSCSASHPKKKPNRVNAFVLPQVDSRVFDPEKSLVFGFLISNKKQYNDNNKSQSSKNFESVLMMNEDDDHYDIPVKIGDIIKSASAVRACIRYYKDRANRQKFLPHFVRCESK